MSGGAPTIDSCSTPFKEEAAALAAGSLSSTPMLAAALCVLVALLAVAVHFGETRDLHLCPQHHHMVKCCTTLIPYKPQTPTLNPRVHAPTPSTVAAHHMNMPMFPGAGAGTCFQTLNPEPLVACRRAGGRVSAAPGHIPGGPRCTARCVSSGTVHRGEEGGHGLSGWGGGGARGACNATS